MHILIETTARQLKRPPVEVHLLRLAALLHDISTIGIPQAILHKPGSLIQEEWTLMRQHPELGRQMLEQVGGVFYTEREKRYQATPPHAMLVHSSHNVPQVIRGASPNAILRRSTSSKSAPIMQQSRIEKPCASAVSGSSPCSRKAKTGMVYEGFGYVCSGGSIVRRS